MSDRFTLDRELETREGQPRQWLVKEQGSHSQYWPMISVHTAYGIDCGELAKAAIEGWNQWYERTPHNFK